MSFLGIGDPLLADHPSIINGDVGGPPEVSELTGSGVSSHLETGSPVNFNIGTLFSSLPETSDELSEISATFGPETTRLLLRENATEKILKNDVRFSDYRIVAFATHGLIAGQIDGITEPSLVLTPPETASKEDDGLLTSSEITAMKMNADWVILSACNTAAPDGEPGAEGLSGLSRSFFYAGARSLLVSHWSVRSEPTVELTTSLMRILKNNPGTEKAEAHRQAMVNLRNSDMGATYSHPGIWGAFTVVGQGSTLSNVTAQY